MPIAQASSTTLWKARRAPSGDQRGNQASTGRSPPIVCSVPLPDVQHEDRGVLPVGVGVPGEAPAVRRPLRCPVVEVVVGDELHARALRARPRRHDRGGVALTVVGAQGDARAVGRELKIGVRGEVPGCRRAGSRGPRWRARSDRSRSTPSPCRRARSTGSGRRRSTWGSRRDRRWRGVAAAPPRPGCRPCTAASPRRCAIRRPPCRRRARWRRAGSRCRRWARRRAVR